MNRFIRKWKSISISKKLYAVTGIMAVLIVAELLVLWFAMDVLTSVRAFVEGEGHWSKAQRDAMLALQRYTQSHKQHDYEEFLNHLKVNEGDRIARLELNRPKPNFEIVRRGFLQGRNHPDDIEPMISLLRRFHWQPHLTQAIEAWTQADELILQLHDVGARYNRLVLSKRRSRAELLQTVASIQALNTQLTILENRFSRVLGEGSRWLESLILTLLSFAVLTVETIGLSLAFLTSRSISHGLAEISDVAHAIGHGDFSRRAVIKSKDELGEVGESINLMGEMLQKSYIELEAKVQARTAELANAVRTRDDFLSIASHELKTPLTSLSLQTQIRKRMMDKSNGSHVVDATKFEKMLQSDDKQIKRLVHLVDDMLDISRLSAKKLVIAPSTLNLSQLVRSVIERFHPNFQQAHCEVSFELEESVYGSWDESRLEQVIENLLTNAMKYGAGDPIRVRCYSQGETACIEITDHGMGIAPQDHERIFRQFERAVTGYSVSGLGLGLYISNEIVRMHGGRIQVASQIGKGSQFTVILPRYSDEQKNAA